MAEAVAAPTVRDALTEAAARLAAAGVDTPRLDAELLLGWALGAGRCQLVMAAQEKVSPDAVERFGQLVERRAAREPVAYILGRKAFRHIELVVDRRVLIPRPETELLVEVGLTLPARARVADVGTGSGAVALALKHERPDLEVIGTDASADALTVARSNATRLGLDVRFEQVDLLQGVGGPWGAVLANLPYVPEGVPLAPEISRYEPAGALFAGPDGLDHIRRLIGMLDGAALVGLEIGFGQEETVGALLGGVGFQSIERLRDLAGHERVVLARR